MMSLSPLPPDLYAYSPPESLWELVRLHVQESEQDEIKSLLGESLVDQSLELHQEIEMFLDIWRDYRDETQHLACNKLPEPPQVRDRLVQEIRFFVENIREKAKDHGQDFDDILSQHNKKVLNYVLGNERPGSCRPTSARSISDGRVTPMRRKGTPGSDGMSLGSTLSEEVESMNDKLNILKLDEIAIHLRQTLEDEVQQLLGDIRFLQECLEDEAEFRCESRADHNPSIADLREERSKLEYDLLNTEHSIPAMPNVGRRHFNPTDAIKKIASPPSGARRKSSDHHRPSSRPGPLRATHSIDVGIPSAASDSRGLATLQLDGPEHVTLRTSGRSKSERVVQVITGSKPPLKPSPPKSVKPANTRPSSADRFRRMVVDTRGST